MDPYEALVYAWMATISLATIIGTIYLIVRLRTDRQYRREFWQALDQEWEERQR